MATAIESVHWEPQQGPQTALLSCPVEDVLFGGARGGGKTDGLLGDWLSHADLWGENARGMLLRRTYPELEEIQERAAAIFSPLAPDGWRSGARTWIFPNGARLKFRQMERDVDADRYQGHSYTWLGFDELTQWPSPVPIDKLRATLRSAGGARCVMRATANPGGAGHNWVKARYIDPAGPYEPHADEHGTLRVFIPSRLDDNRILQENDPGYWRRVEAAAGGNQALLKAWRNGIWDIVAGGMFDDLWCPRHVLPVFTIPAGWRIDRAYDWGSSKPFSVGWWAEANGEAAKLPDGRAFCPPRGSLVRIAEWYGWDGKTPNAGLRMTDSAVGQGIVQREKEWGIHGRCRPGPADSSIFSANPGQTSPADSMAIFGAKFVPADKSPGSRKRGWEAMRRMLTESASVRPEAPGLWAVESCRQFIRTVPVLPREPKDLDDVNTEAEDHVADETRYRILAVPAPSVRFSSVSA